MGADEDRMKAMRYERPEYIPVRVSLLPAAWMKYREDLDAIVARHPIIFGKDQPKNRDYDAVNDPKYSPGDLVDAWGCVWSTPRTGMAGIVTGHPVPTREAVHTLKPPVEDDGMPHGFMFLRLTDLRGYEEMMVDFAEEPPELQMLIDVVLKYNMRQIEKLLADPSMPHLMHFGDDLGTQNGLPISPAKWRKYLKPCFAKIYGRCHEAGHSVYMHTDGHILDIIPDLVDCGVNVVNAQVRANGLDGLARVCKGKLCVDLDLDRQMFPFVTPQQIDEHVLDVVQKLGSPEGGLWLAAECAPDVPLENIEAICQALEKHRGHFKN